MNTDLLIKLVRLANNNPNDNEANLSARKVCKMLADAIDSGKLNFRKRSVPNSKPFSPTMPNKQSYKEWWDLFNQMNNQKWSSQRYDNEYRNKYDSHYYNYDYPPRGEKPKKEKQRRDCMKCGEMFETTYQGPEYKCNKCSWADYEGSK